MDPNTYELYYSSDEEEDPVEKFYEKQEDEIQEDMQEEDEENNNNFKKALATKEIMDLVEKNDGDLNELALVVKQVEPELKVQNAEEIQELLNSLNPPQYDLNRREIEKVLPMTVRQYRVPAYGEKSLSEKTSEELVADLAGLPSIQPSGPHAIWKRVKEDNFLVDTSLFQKKEEISAISYYQNEVYPYYYRYQFQDCQDSMKQLLSYVRDFDKMDGQQGNFQDIQATLGRIDIYTNDCPTSLCCRFNGNIIYNYSDLDNERFVIPKPSTLGFELAHITSVKPKTFYDLKKLYVDKNEIMKGELDFLIQGNSRGFIFSRALSLFQDIDHRLPDRGYPNAKFPEVTPEDYVSISLTKSFGLIKRIVVVPHIYSIRILGKNVDGMLERVEEYKTQFVEKMNANVVHVESLGFTGTEGYLRQLVKWIPAIFDRIKYLLEQAKQFTDFVQDNKDKNFSVDGGIGLATEKKYESLIKDLEEWKTYSVHAEVKHLNHRPFQQLGEICNRYLLDVRRYGNTINDEITQLLGRVVTWTIPNLASREFVKEVCARAAMQCAAEHYAETHFKTVDPNLGTNILEKITDWTNY